MVEIIAISIIISIPATTTTTTWAVAAKECEEETFITTTMDVREISPTDRVEEGEGEEEEEAFLVEGAVAATEAVVKGVEEDTTAAAGDLRITIMTFIRLTDIERKFGSYSDYLFH